MDRGSTIQSFYDYIVLGATLPGVLFAAEKSRAGHSVLLTNQYGFPGGSISELLNCHQTPPSENCSALLSGLYGTITGDNLAPSVVNPESIKYSLQQFLETIKVDLYYHVMPKMITADTESNVTVTLLAKEGLTTIQCRNVFDATDDLSGAMILGLPVSSGERNINLFITTPNSDGFLSFPKIRRYVRLDDGRYWISLRIDSTDELFSEDESHMLLDEFRIILERFGSRIQILPLGIHSQTTCSSGTALNGSFKTVDELIGRTFEPWEQFTRSSALLEVIEHHRI